MSQNDPIVITGIARTPMGGLQGMGGMNNMPDAGANELEMTPTPTAGS